MAASAGGERKGWLPASDEEMEEAVLAAVRADLERTHNESVHEVVPWFFDNMPASYFKAVEKDARLSHLRAITAVKVSGMAPDLTIKDAETKTFTFIRPTHEAKEGVSDDCPSVSQNFKLSQFLEELPIEGSEFGWLSRVSIFETLDHSMTLNMFKFGDRHTGNFNPNDNTDAVAVKNLQEYIAADIIGSGTASGFPVANGGKGFQGEAFDTYLKGCTSSYVQRSSPRRFCLQAAMHASVYGTDRVAVHVESGTDWSDNSEDKNLVMVTVAAANVQPKQHMEKLAKHLAVCGLDIKRAHLDVVADPAHPEDELVDDRANNNVSMIRLLCDPGNHKIDVNDCDKMMKDIKRLKWLDNRVLNYVYAHKVRVCTCVHTHPACMHRVDDAAGGGWRRLAAAGGGWRRLAAAGGGWRRLAAAGGGSKQHCTLCCADATPARFVA
jgi:hypothetical protein